MKLVAVARAPMRPEEAARALAAATGVTPAEARMRLAPEPPAVVARVTPEEADRIVAALRAAGLAALSVDARVPTDGDRTVARTFTIAASGVTFTPSFGEPMAVSWPEVVAVLRGQRASRRELERTETSRSFSPTTAIATGGLKLSRTTTTTVRSVDDASEQVILLYARDGRAAMLAESRVDFSCLGAALQPSSTANMGEVARQLRERAPGAFHDDRLLRLGRRPLPFVAGGESRTRSGAVTTTRIETGSSLDVLAEVLRRAASDGLLP